MNDLFISKLHINKVRHLENIIIELANDEKKHLILTGKNGSGKTSLILMLHDHLTVSISPEHFWNYDDEGIKCYKSIGTGNLGVSLNTSNKNLLHNQTLNPYFGKGELVIEHLFRNFLLIYMPAHRIFQPRKVEAIEKVDVNPKVISSKDIVAFMVLHWSRMTNSYFMGNQEQTENINNWFKLLKENMRKIFNEPSLEMTYVDDELDFMINIFGRETVALSQMADGHLALLHIMTEIMMKMEGSASMTYDIPGIVLIDEVETHLHVELQRLVLPFLTKMFPRIQFIVTTHSPFVISSLPNAVVYDLERQIRVEDMSGYSYDAVVEHYYDINQYSLEANKQFEIYRDLQDKKNRTTDESKQFIEALTYLNMLPAAAAPELFIAFRDLESQRKERHNNGQNK